MVSKKKSLKGGDSLYTMIFKGFFAGALGGILAAALIGIICLILFATGLYIIKTYNKPKSKLFQDIQSMQYVGIVLCLLGLAPFIRYFFFGILSSAGSSFTESFSDEF